MASLRSIIQCLRRNDVSSDCWLYIAGDARDLSLETDADLGSSEFDKASDEEIDPPGFGDRGLRSTIDKATLEDCLEWADRLAGDSIDAAAADVIRYYIRFDAFPQMLNAPDPPPADVWLRRLDHDFCEKLGQEDAKTRCRYEGCGRGTVKLSAFCRRHHFENVTRRVYPY